MYNYILARTQDYAQEKLLAYDASHDWQHTERVYKTATKFAQAMPESDVFVVQMAALLHDVFDHKYGFTIEQRTSELDAYLTSYNMAESFRAKIIQIINEISFSENKGKTPSTIEGAIVQDADRLDAIGAIGIARAFTYGAVNQRAIYCASGEQPDTISHFDQKLLHVKDLMNTAMGKVEAQRRHLVMEQFLAAFYQDIQA